MPGIPLLAKTEQMPVECGNVRSISEPRLESGFLTFGVNFGDSNKVRFNLEYMQYLDKNDASAIGVGVLF